MSSSSNNTGTQAPISEQGELAELSHKPDDLTPELKEEIPRRSAWPVTFTIILREVTGEEAGYDSDNGYDA